MHKYTSSYMRAKNVTSLKRIITSSFFFFSLSLSLWILEISIGLLLMGLSIMRVHNVHNARARNFSHHNLQPLKWPRVTSTVTQNRFVVLSLIRFYSRAARHGVCVHLAFSTPIKRAISMILSTMRDSAPNKRGITFEVELSNYISSKFPNSKFGKPFFV